MRTFLATALLGAIPALMAVITTPKLDLHAAINAHHNPVTDTLFKYITHLGDGLTASVVALFLLLRVNWRAFLLAATGLLSSSILVQLLKRTIFSGEDRPWAFLGQMPGVQLVAGIDLNHHFSFPSGHSASIFALCFALATVIGRQSMAFGLAVLACVVAFSRVYLSQHFTADILGGALLGMMGSLGAYWWLHHSPFSQRPWLERSPFRR